MKGARWTGPFAVVTLVALAACGVPGPVIPPSSPASTEVRSHVLATPPAGREILLDVRFAGTVGCSMFPYSCVVVVSVLDAGASAPAGWRPPDTDPTWYPDDRDHDRDGRSPIGPDPVRGMPVLAPGRHRVVVSLLGSYDTPSYNPDGTVASDLLGRCAADVEVAVGDPPVPITVSFDPDPASFRAACSIVTGGR
jgi:hypothetical protein